jgi:hypothetical protein
VKPELLPVRRAESRRTTVAESITNNQSGKGPILSQSV